jgi:hypothetical protein
MAFRDVHNQFVGEESSLIDLLKESKDLKSSKKSQSLLRSIDSV